LEVNTTVTDINLGDEEIDLDGLIARNERLRHLFLFDARQMLLSLMCVDECGVVWPYLLGSGNTDGIIAADAVESLRAEFDAVVEERRRRAARAAESLVSADVDTDGSSRAVKRRRTEL
jgi:hypothetical protein